ncbi:MAG TPA: DUF1800 domain-containing protein [Steroidobacteraceae bacterium]|nr:DUF1800 domain-containing protein [Steroidobacteraceae bacterium]
MGPERLRIASHCLAIAVLAAGCATRTEVSRDARDAAAAPLRAMRREDALWLERVSFGLDSASVESYRQLGRERFLERQLHPGAAALPDPIAAEIAALEISHADPGKWLADVNAGYKAINATPDGADKEQARKALNDRGNRLAYEAIRRNLLRAVYSPAQLQEQMVWFWLNHFSVYQYKANLRWLVGDYEERAIRPHVLGHFKDLVMASLQHPAMLQYLDNNQNASGHINENYARELLELHTLGVSGGYSQHDVQELARVLTGVGVNAGDAPKLKPDLQRLYVRSGAFEFNPARHDFGAKTLLGHTITGNGFGEVENAVGLIVSQPACARFIARELAVYFVADNPPPALVERMAQTFMHSDGDIAAVLRELFLSRELAAALGGKFKDPTRYIVSAIRFAYDGRPISNTRPMLNWLNGLGEAPYGRQTPDGYPLTELGWASSGQISRRFEIARALGAGNAGLFDPDNGAATGAAGFPQLSGRLYFEAVEPFLAARTKEALNRANSQQEWNTFLLSSPEFSYE